MDGGLVIGILQQWRIAVPQDPLWLSAFKETYIQQYSQSLQEDNTRSQ